MSTSQAVPGLLPRLAAAAYRRVVGLRNRYYERPGAARRGALPVVSVGNVTVGGTGKTPLVTWLAGELRELGLRPAVVSRGYRGRAGAGPLIVSRGEGPLCDARSCGDEPFLLARTLPGVPVVVGSDRLAGVAEARRLGAGLALLDDGFQHRRLARDLDIVLIDAGNPFGGNALLPAGRLREPLGGLGRADVIVITRAEPRTPLPAIDDVLEREAPRALRLRASHRSVGFFDSGGRPVDAPDRAVVFCGIGNPERFRADLERLGLEIVAFRSRRDHHWFRPAELRELIELAGRHDARLVSTEKDLVRLPATTPALALRIEAVVHEPTRLLDAVREAVGARRPR